MMTYSNEKKGHLASASILLASDSERHGNPMHRLLQEDGFAIDFAGSYSGIEDHLDGKNYDVVLLEVTSEHAVESAVDTALRVKRARAGQFVGYLADADLENCGLAGDAIFPRNAGKLREALRRVLVDGSAE